MDSMKTLSHCARSRRVLHARDDGLHPRAADSDGHAVAGEPLLHARVAVDAGP